MLHENGGMDGADTHAECLEALRLLAAGRVESSAAALETLVHDRASLNDDDEHDPDGAPLSAEWSRLAGQSDAAKSELRQIEAALLRIEAGTYGVCVTCGRRIPDQRLRVRPFAEQCVACAERSLPRR